MGRSPRSPVTGAVSLQENIVGGNLLRSSYYHKDKHYTVKSNKCVDFLQESMRSRNESTQEFGLCVWLVFHRRVNCIALGASACASARDVCSGEAEILICRSVNVCSGRAWPGVRTQYVSHKE